MGKWLFVSEQDMILPPSAPFTCSRSEEQKRHECRPGQLLFLPEFNSQLTIAQPSVGERG
jgi:hypothetical protein